jgi:mycofactocin glycosyltransferase
VTTPVPSGFRVAPDPALRTADHGRVLIGGAPLRILRLTPAGAAAVRALFRGEPVGSSPGRARLARRLLDLALAHPDPPPAPPGALTVVIPVKDDPPGLGRTLDTLTGAASRLDPARILVVDDGSADAEAVVRCAHDRATVIRRALAGGPGVARSEGLARVSTEVVAFVDAGVEVDPEVLDRLADHLADPAVVAVAPRVVSPPGPGALARFESEHSPLDLGDRPAPVRPGTPVPYVPTACVLARTGSVRAVGGFDAALRYGEDVDLIWRMVDAGGVVRYDPTVTVRHPPRATLRDWLRQRYRYGSAAGALARRHGRIVSPARVSGWSMAGWALAVAGRPFAALAVTGWTARALRPRLAALPEPGAEAVRLAVVGHTWAARGLSRQLVRSWWPLTAVACLHPKGRRLALIGAVASVVEHWSPGDRGHRGTTAVLGLLDDLAYGAGVWGGLGGRDAARAVVPDLVTWPVRADGRLGKGLDVTGR